MGDVDWFKNAIIYHILIDRFAGFKSTKNWNEPTFLGGNIKGIIKKLPYLRNLGVNTLWISPFFKTNTYHGYHIIGFYQVEPHFGTTQDIKKLIEVLNNLVDKGNTVVVIEHNLEVIKSADYIIDLGPEGGDLGGEVIAYGTPEKVAQNKKSYTGIILHPNLPRKQKNV